MWRRIAIGSILLLLIGIVPGFPSVGQRSASAAPDFPASDIVDEFVAGGNWTRSAAAEFLPDGRLLAATQTGTVYLVDTTTGSTTTLFTLPGVLSAGEAGLLDIAVDPAFTTNNVFYLYSTDTGRRARVDRFVLSGTSTLSTRALVWTNPGPTMTAGDYHVGGSLNVGTDGLFYLTTGDNTVGANSQNLTNVWGKVLRFRLDGTVPTDNPFYDGAGPNVDEIWAYGIRNGFRSWIDPLTGQHWLGDVGGNNASTAYEEVNLVQRGANYGWPTCEGPLGPPKSGASCPQGVEAPLYSYGHDVNDSCCMNRAIVGGELYQGSAFPSSFVGTYVYADYPTGTFFWLERNGSTVTSGELKRTSLSGGVPVWLGVSPTDGHIYWMHFGFGNGQIRRLRYTGELDNPPTITQSTASPTSGPAPLAVTFTGQAIDGDGDPVSYSWNFGDGTSATTATANKTYTEAGRYLAQLTVTAGGDTVVSAPITIQVGTPPVPVITAPTITTFEAGDTIQITGQATDADDGPLPASALSWSIVLLHDDHTHPTLSGTGSSITLDVPPAGNHSWEGDTGYRITLTATDSDGLTTDTTLELRPVKTDVSITANIPVDITIDTITESLPATLDTAVGAAHTVAAPSTACVSGTAYAFSNWSSGAAREHTLEALASHPPLVATYVASGTCGPTLYRAVNINGAALTIGGVPFESGLTAPNFSSGPSAFCSPTVTLTPATSAAEAEMIRCSTWGTGNAVTTMTNVPNGSYSVEFWVWEDNDSVTFTPSLNGTPLAPIASGGAGLWQKVGPVPVTVTTNQIVLSATGGDSNFSGIRVWSEGTTPPPPPPPPPPVDTTAPSVVSTNPTNSATNVATTTTPTITFSEATNPNGGITLAIDGGATIPTTITTTGATTTITPTTQLTPGTTYRITITTAVTDLAGNPLQNSTTTTFTTATTPPPTPTGNTELKVSRLNTRGNAKPLDGDLWTPGEQLYVFLDSPTPATTVRFYLDTPTTGTPIRTEALAPWDFGGGSTDTANPFTNTLTNGQHTIRALVTRPDGTTQTYTATFTVGTTPPPPPPVDTTPPSVVSTNPTNSATNVATTTTPTITFSEATNPNGGITLAIDGGATIPTTITTTGATTTITPTTQLTPGTTYRIIITTAVTDLAGNPLQNSTTTTFTTAPPPPVDTTAPSVVSTNPTNSATNVATTTTPTITFSEATNPNGGITLAIDGGATIPTTITTTGATTTITPTTQLTPGTTYRITITTAVTDLAGNPLQNSTTTTFTTATTPPPTPTGNTELKVSRLNTRGNAKPLDGDLWTPGEQLYVFLDSPTPATTVRFYLDTPTTGTPIRTEALAPWDFGGGSTDTANPFTNTLTNGQHTIRALVTRPDGTTQTYTATFTVGTTPPPPPPVDTTPPSVVSTNPTNSATNVATTTTPTITFSEATNPNGGITLAIDGGATIPTTITTTGATTTITPTTQLTPGTTYRITITTAVTDLAGNPLQNSTTTTFTTATTPPPTPTGNTELKVSRLNTRGNAKPLDGDLWTPGEQLYVFLDVTTPAVNVRFYLDTPTTGTPIRTEALAPWDFGGGSTDTANPFTNTLTNGQHTIRALVTRPDGTTQTYTATFTVGSS